MLKHIPNMLPPELVKLMMEMGQGDELLLAEANFPTGSYGPKEAGIVRMDGAGMAETLAAVLQLFPLDERDQKPCTVCKADDDAPEPAIWQAMAEAVAQSEEARKNDQGFDRLERYSFYKRCGDVCCMVITGEQTPHSSIILKKGAV